MVVIALLIVLAVAELVVAAQVATAIGVLNTLFLLVLFSVLGAWIAKRQGISTWRRMRRQLDAGAMPGNELVDGFLVLLGGLLMVVPGFVTDALGLLLLVPPIRIVVRSTIVRRFRARVEIVRRALPRRGPDDIIDV